MPVAFRLRCPQQRKAPRRGQPTRIAQHSNLTLKLTADWVPAGVALTGFLLQQRGPSHLTPHFVEAVHELVKATSSSPELLDQVCNLTKPFGCLPSP